MRIDTVFGLLTQTVSDTERQTDATYLGFSSCLCVFVCCDDDIHAHTHMQCLCVSVCAVSLHTSLFAVNMLLSNRQTDTANVDTVSGLYVCACSFK